MNTGTIRDFLVFAAVIFRSACVFASDQQLRERDWEQQYGVAIDLIKNHKYNDSEKFLVVSVKHAETFGEDDPRLVKSLRTLALAFAAQEKFADAEPHCTRTLAILERTRPASDPVTIRTMDATCLYL